MIRFLVIGALAPALLHEVLAVVSVLETSAPSGMARISLIAR